LNQEDFKKIQKYRKEKGEREERERERERINLIRLQEQIIFQGKY